MDLRRERDLGLIFITHDVGLAWALCDRVAVMYLGRIIEQGTTEQVLADPRHPYTQALLSVVPSPIPRADGERRTILEGELPDASRIPVRLPLPPPLPGRVRPLQDRRPGRADRRGWRPRGGVLDGRRLTQQRGQTPHRSRWHFCHTRATNRARFRPPSTSAGNAAVTEEQRQPMRGLTPGACLVGG